jgi:hypothetical protein
MERNISCQAARIAARSGNEDGLLIFADHVLMAVVSHLQKSVSGEMRSHWFLEAGFGACETRSDPPEFESPDEAQKWVSDRLNNASGSSHTVPSKGADDLPNAS